MRKKKLTKEELRLKREEHDQKLSAYVMSKFQQNMNAKAPITEEWMQYMNAYNNSLYEHNDIPDYRSNQVSNLIYSTIESMRPIMFDGNPKFEAIPVSKESLQYCTDMNTILDFEFQRTKMKKILISNSIPQLCLGNAIIYLPYQYNSDNADGDVEPIPINPFNLYPDPLATSVEDAENIIYASYMHEGVLKQKYPQFADKIDNGGGGIEYDELTPNRNEDTSVNHQILVLEMWCRDYSTEEFEDKDNDGNVVTKIKRKFPRGRVIITAPHLGLILEDKPNPYKSGRFPFFIFKDIDIPFKFWGEGEIKWLLSPQQGINDLTNQIIDNAKSTANMQWVVDKTAGIPQGQLSNRPGLVIRKNPGSEVRRDSPPSMPMYVSEMISRLENNIEVVSGVHDVTRGQAPGGSLESGAAILALQDAANTRIRLKNTLVEETLGELGTEWFNRIKQFWKSERIIPKRRSESQNQPHFKREGLSLVLDKKQEDTFDFVTISPTKQLQYDYRVIVIGASGSKNNRASMLDTMTRLIQTQAEDGMPVVPREAVLDYIPNVNKEIIMDYFTKMKEEKQKEVEQQQMSNEAMEQLQQLLQVVQELSSSVGQLQQAKAEEDNAQQRDSVLQQGYQQGVAESQTLQNQIDRSGQLPPDMLQQLSQMDDEELGTMLLENPDLMDMIRQQ